MVDAAEIVTSDISVTVNLSIPRDKYCLLRAFYFCPYQLHQYHHCDDERVSPCVLTILHIWTGPLVVVK